MILVPAALLNIRYAHVSLRRSFVFAMGDSNLNLRLYEHLMLIKGEIKWQK
jgi:hypothetical protein